MKYDTSIVERILELFGTGDHSIKDICKIVKISPMTFHRWREEKSDFSDRLKEVEEMRIESLKDLSRTGLVKLLNGYQYEEISREMASVPYKVRDEKTGKYEVQFDSAGKVITRQYPSKIKSVTKYIMPNPTAVLSTLKNLDPENFPDVSKLDHTTGGEKLNSVEQLLTLSPEELRKKKLEIQAKLNNNGK